MTQSMKQTRKPQKKNGPFQRGQQKIKLSINKPRGVLPPLSLPYPPKIDLQKMVAKLASKPKLARFPNAFILYRNEYVQFLKGKDLHLSMTELSPMIAAAWKQEPECVKDAYTQLSSEAEKLYVRVAANAQPEIKYKFPTQQRHSDYDYSTEASIARKNNETITKYDLSQYTNQLLEESSTFTSSKNYPCDIRSSSIRSGHTLENDPSISNMTSSISESTFDNNPLVKQQESCYIQDTPFIPWTRLNEPLRDVIPEVIHHPQPRSSSTGNGSVITCGDLGITFPEQQIFGQMPPSPALDTPCSENAFLENHESVTQPTKFYLSPAVSPVQPFSDESSSHSPNFGEFEVNDITSDLYYVIDSALSGSYAIPTPRDN
ncbi:11403_t:CDS:2 [Acaulospora colombiana]|uniref:11403_t:CDS:1 n=1 Tax=Acaulospora colombiana TaxID=27376 RepID=A0ACA9MFH7_9GLOM|nr:11403_t:CDS:2 [Acaulospora colombiana]